MPTWNSKDGIWYVAKERVALRNNSNQTIKNPSAEWSKYSEENIGPGEPFIYEGPDRAALFELYQIDSTGQVQTMGQEFFDDPDLQDRARQRGYKSVLEYAKSFGWNKEKSDARFAELKSETVLHEMPKRVAMIEAAQSGGDDTSGMGQGRKGGFGERPAD